MAVDQPIPVVNLEDYRSDEPDRRAAFVETFGDGLSELGFVAVEGHGVPQSLIDQNYALFRQLFDLGEQTKRNYERPESGRQRGYTPFGLEHAKDSEKPDLKEFWYVGREIDGDEALAERMPPNVWPSEVPELREAALSLFFAMERSAMQMLGAISEYLGLDQSLLPEKAQQGNHVLRVIHYPVCEGFDEPGAMRAAAHEDINLITLLPAATKSGLEIESRDGDWIPVPTREGQIIVDTGDMMKRLTNDVMRATTHRVVNPAGEPEPRYSMPFFVHPHPEARLDVLEACVDEKESAKYEPIRADEFLQQRLEETGVS